MYGTKIHKSVPNHKPIVGKDSNVTSDVKPAGASTEIVHGQTRPERGKDRHPQGHEDSCFRIRIPGRSRRLNLKLLCAEEWAGLSIYSNPMTRLP